MPLQFIIILTMLMNVLVSLAQLSTFAYILVLNTRFITAYDINQKSSKKNPKQNSKNIHIMIMFVIHLLYTILGIKN